MVRANRLLGRSKKNYEEETTEALSIMTQDEIREEVLNFNYESLGISLEDKRNLIDIEKDMVFQGKRLGEIGYKIGENLEKARNIFKKYSTTDGDPDSFVNWYSAMGLNKDQAYLFRGRFKLCINKPKYKENILALSDRAIKETITKDIPEPVLEKVLVGELKTGKDIKKAKEEFKISSTLEISEIESKIIGTVEIVDDNEELILKKEREISYLKRDIKEREQALRKLYKELSDLEKEVDNLKVGL